MALKSLNSEGGFGLANGNVVIDPDGNFSASNLTVSGTSNLGPIANVTITGGSNGQVIVTDGNGNLSFTNSSSNRAAPMPYLIPNGESYIVNENFQGLFFEPIDIEGEFQVDGILIDVSGGGNGGGGGGTATGLNAPISNVIITGGSNGYFLQTNGSGNLSWSPVSATPGGSNTQIQFNDANSFGGNSEFTFNKVTGVVTTPNLTINGQVNLTGNIIPTANVAYDLGNNTNRFNDLYLSGTTINLGNANISANSTAVIITNPAGGAFVIGGNANTSTSVLANGNSNITIANNSSIGITANGVSNVALITKNGLDITGTIGATGDITTLGNISALGNFSVVDIAASGNLSVTGNVSMGNANITGSFAASGNLSGVNINTSGDLSVLGNANIQTNLYVGTNAIVNTRLTVGNPNAVGKSDFYTNGYGSLSILDVSGNVAANNISISSNLSVTGNASIGTLQTSGVNALGNISAANIVSNGSVTANGNISSLNANLGNLALANFFQGDGRYLTNITVAGGTTIINGNSNVFVEPNANVIFSVNGSPNVITVTETNTYFSTNIVSNANIFTTNIKNGNVSVLLNGSSNSIGLNAGAGNVLEISNTYIEVTGNANISNVLRVTGNTVLGNLSASFANISNANVGNITAASNITAGNINGGNLVTANFFQGDGYLISNLTIVAGSAITNGNSNVQVAPNANVTITAEGNANVVTVTGNSVILTTQLLGANANFNTANITTLNATSLAVQTAFNVNANINTTTTLNARNLVITQDIANGFYGGASLAGNMNVGSNLFVSGYSNVGQINASGIQVGDSLNANNTVSANTVSSAITLSTSGNLSVSGNTTLNNRTNVNANLNVSANITAGNINGGNLVSANFFSGDGYLLSNLTVTGGTSLINGTSNLFVDGSGNVRTSVAGNANVWVVRSSGANLTGTLSVSGNANIGNIGAGAGLFTGNVTGANANFSGNLIASGFANISGNISGNGSISANGNITSLNANLGNLASANFFQGDGYLLTNLTIPTGTAIINGSSNVLVTANSNVNITVNGTPNVLQVAEYGVIVNGNLRTTGEIVGASFANGSSNIAITSNGAVDISANGVDALLSIRSNGVFANTKIFGLQGLSVTGNSNIGNLGLTGFITTPGQVSAGNLTSSGDLTVAANANLANTRISGALTTIGNISAGNISTGGVANVAELYVGSLGANINGYTKINANLDVTGNINVTGNLNYSNVTDLVVGDPLIYIGANNPGDTYDLGVVASYTVGTLKYTGIARNEVDGVWTFFDNVSTHPTTVIDWANASYPTVKLGNLVTTGNVNISGNVSANYFNGNVVGNISGTITVGSNTQVLFSDSGVIAGNNAFTFNKTTGAVTVTGNITGGNLVTGGALSVTGNSNVGNLGTTGVFATTLSASGNANVGNIGATLFVGTLATGAQPNITSTGTLTSLSVSGNANIGNIGTGGLITATGNITGGNIVTAGSISATGNGTFGNIITGGSITTSGSGGNITGANVISANAFTATGNITGGNLITTGLVSATGNITGGNLITTGLVSATGNITGGNLVTSGALSVTGNANVGNIGAVRGVFTGNISGNNLSITANITTGNLGGANLVSANFVEGTLTTAAQPNITSIGVLSSLVSTGNITAGNFVGRLANGNSNISIPSANGNIAFSSAGNANIVVITGTGANITGTANITGNLSVGSKSNLGPASNVIITGGTANYVLSTDGAGNLSWVAQSGGGGGSANIAIYDDGNLLTSNVTSLDFVGSGVTATNTGNAVTVTITGGGGGQAAITLDSFTGNGVQTAFTLSTAPASENYTFVNIDGVDQLKTAYSVSGTTLTFSSAPSNGANIEVTIVSAVSSAQPSFTTRTYTGNGVQTTFTVTNGVTSTGVLVTENGILQTPGTDYTVSGANLTFTTAPANAQAIQIRELGTVVANGTGPATSTVDTFTGNGVQTAFTLSTTPVDENWTLVNYNGVLLLKSDYSVSGNVLTISSAPANGATVEVTTFSQLGGPTSATSARALGYSLVFGG